MVPKLFGTRGWFHGRQFFHELGGGGLKLKLQYFGYLMQTYNSLEKTIMLGKTEGKWRRGCQRMRWLDGITEQWIWTWANSRRWWGTGRPVMLQSMGSRRGRHDWATEQLWGWGMVWDDLSALHLLCTLFPVLLHQPHLRLSDIRSWRLGTPV